MDVLKDFGVAGGLGFVTTLSFDQAISHHLECPVQQGFLGGWDGGGGDLRGL